MRKTKGQIEAEITEADVRFEKEFMGRGPTEARTHLIDELVIVRLKGLLTPAEHQLAQTNDGPRGRDLIKQVRRELLEKGRPLLEAIIEASTGCGITSLHTDISTVTGERVIVFTLDGAPHALRVED